MTGPSKTPLDKAKALTYWVRRHVRYLSRGPGGLGYTPHLPDQVLANRYGDCKDQAQLLAVMLKEIGLPVWLVTLGDPRRRPGAAGGSVAVGNARHPVGEDRRQGSLDRHHGVTGRLGLSAARRPRSADLYHARQRAETGQDPPVYLQGLSHRTNHQRDDSRRRHLPVQARVQRITAPAPGHGATNGSKCPPANAAAPPWPSCKTPTARPASCR